jgi:hypothetical protein
VNGAIAPSFNESISIRHDQIEINVNRVAETLTNRTRAERRIETEKARFRFFVNRAVVFADEFFGKIKVCGSLFRPFE